MQTFFLDVYIDTMASFSKLVRHLTYLTKYRVASPYIDRSSQADEHIQDNLQTKETGLWTRIENGCNSFASNKTHKHDKGLL